MNFEKMVGHSQTIKISNILGSSVNVLLFTQGILSTNFIISNDMELSVVSHPCTN